VADIDTSWSWNFTGPTTMSKAQSRSSLPKEISWDLIGFDGNEVGSLRTHPGFKSIDTFTPIDGVANVIGFFPVALLTSSTTYVYGYVWAEYVAGGPSIKFYARFNDGTNWLTPDGSTNASGLLQTYTDAALTSSTDIDVQVSGRFLMLFVRGQKPRIIVLAVPSTWNTSTTNADLGPGTAPVATAQSAQTPTTATTNNPFYVANLNTGTGPTYTVGNYSFAVQYLSTTTGRKSSLSNVVVVTTTSSNNKINFSVIRPSSDYDRAFIYRSVNLGTGSGASTYGNGTLHLDQTVTVTGTATTGYISIPDTQLVYQDIYVDQGKADSYGPKGGVAGFMGNTLFVSRISDSSSSAPTGGGITPDSPPRAIGDMRWSATSQMSPENFNPSNRWVPRTPGNEVIGMRGLGNYMIALSADRLYRVGRAGAFIKVEEGHLGYGLQGKYALEAIGTMVYFVSGGGLKAVSSDGQVEDVTSLDNLINVTWASTRSTLQLAFDARGQCLTVMQPDTGSGLANGRAAILWFGTNRVTELADLPFRWARTGHYTASGSLQRRTLFVKRDSTTTMGVYIVDHEREVAYPKNLCGGTARFVTTSAVTPTAQEFDCSAYKVSDGTRSLVGTVSGGHASNVYSLAPMLQQWVGGNIGTQVQPGEPEFKDFFRQKQISSVRSYFETLAVPASLPSTATWRGVAYRGSETTEYSIGKPLDNTGVALGSFSTSNTNPGYLANAPLGTGRHGILWSSLSPGWRCDVVGIDTRLLAFSVVGRILDSDRRYT